MEKARAAKDAGELRWAAQLLDHVVFADPEHEPVRVLLADTLEALGFGAENGTWRGAYMSGAMVLRTGNFGTPTVTASPDIVAHLSPQLFFDALAVQVDGPAAWDLDLALRWTFPDHDSTVRDRAPERGPHLRAGHPR